MASGPKNTFNKALERFRDSLTEEQKRQFSAASLEDVESEIQRIQHRFGSEKKLRNLKKVSKFLEAMKQVEQVIIVFLNVHEAVAFVWGPVKLALVVAGTRIDSLERLLDTYVEIGEVIPGLRQYDQLFEKCPSVRQVLEWYLYDILQFHRKALDVFARPAWETVLRSAWKTFETSFKPILDSLKRHRTLLSDEKLTAAIAEIQDTRKLAVTRFNEQSAQSNTRFDELSQKLYDRFQELSKQLYESQERSAEKEAREQQEALRQQRRFVAEKLGPPDYDADQQRASEQRFSASGDWILKDSGFLKWLDPRNPSYSTMYLHGIPGAGKTTLVSRIIDHLRSQTTASKTRLLFFYFKHHEENKKSMRGMLRAVLVQLLYQDDTLIEYFYQKCCSTSTSELRTLSVLKELAQESLRTQHCCLIVLDGLDECGDEQNTRREESKGIIEWFQNSVMPDSRSEGGCIRLLLAGQRDGVLDQHLSAYPGIKLDTIDAHLRDIRDYAESRSSEIRLRFSLSDDNQAKIRDKVTATSKGMFLYTKVVLDNLMDQGSEAELEDELQAENFPDGLNSAYNRVAVRVLERPTRSKREAAERILSWITCAARPLRWREIQSRFCINFEQGCCNVKNRRVDSCKVLCGSLVEAEQCNRGAPSGAEIVISLVHDTAGKYLVHTGRIRLFEEHAKMAVFCSRYLTSGPFKHDLRESSIRDFALSGYYGFQDYAAAFWHHHVDFVLNLAANRPMELNGDIVESIICLLGDYEVKQQTGSTTSGSQPNLTAQHIREILQEWRNNGQKDSFEERTSPIRRVIELIDLAELDDRGKAVFLGLNGVPHFKCPKPRCQRFALGFMDRQTRDTHVEEHERPFKCPNEGCFARSIGFPSQSVLDAHIKRLHSDSDGFRPLFPSSGPKKTNIFTACTRGDIDAVKAFVRQGIDLNKTTQPRGQLTPLVLAARNGHVLVCQYLIQQGAHIFPSNSITSREAITALGEAIKRRDYDLFHILVETVSEHEMLALLGRSSPPNLQHYIQAAVASGDVEILKDLLSWYNNPKDMGGHQRTALQRAAEQGHEEAVRLLVELGADVNVKDASGKTALQLAVEQGHEAVARLLIEKGADINTSNSNGWTPLLQALEKGQAAVARLLIEKGADINTSNSNGWTPLLQALEKGQAAVARLLIEKGADVNASNKDGWTPLLLASEKDYEGITKLLLATEGVDANLKDSSGRTPLSWAAMNGHKGIVKLLLATEAVDANSKDNSGRTPLSWAAGSSKDCDKVNVSALSGHYQDFDQDFDQDFEMQLMLLEQQNKKRLKMARQEEDTGRAAVVQLLLEKGADIEAKDNHGRTPLLWAEENRHEAVIRLLQPQQEIGHASSTALEGQGW